MLNWSASKWESTPASFLPDTHFHSRHTFKTKSVWAQSNKRAFLCQLFKHCDFHSMITNHWQKKKKSIPNEPPLRTHIYIRGSNAGTAEHTHTRMCYPLAQQKEVAFTPRELASLKCHRHVPPWHWGSPNTEPEERPHLWKGIISIGNKGRDTN